MPTGCCVPYCSNRGGHAFPSDNARRKWIIDIKRDKWNQKQAAGFAKPIPRKITLHTHKEKNYLI